MKKYNNGIFPLSNVVLYALGWYERSDNFSNDIRKMLELDGYIVSEYDNYLILIMMHYERFRDFLIKNDLPYMTSVSECMGSVNPLIYENEKDGLVSELIHRLGFYLGCNEIKDICKLQKPTFKKGKIRMPGNKSMTYTSMNKISDKQFK